MYLRFISYFSLIYSFSLPAVPEFAAARRVCNYYPTPAPPSGRGAIAGPYTAARPSLRAGRTKTKYLRFISYFSLIYSFSLPAVPELAAARRVYNYYPTPAPPSGRGAIAGPYTAARPPLRAGRTKTKYLRFISYFSLIYPFSLPAVPEFAAARRVCNYYPTPNASAGESKGRIKFEFAEPLQRKRSSLRNPSLREGCDRRSLR